MVEDVDLQRQVCYVDDGRGNMLYIKDWFCFETTIGLWHSVSHHTAHVGGSISDINLGNCNVVLSSIEGSALGKTGNAMLGSCVSS